VLTEEGEEWRCSANLGEWDSVLVSMSRQMARAE
jgi:hypothetical protein